ncbi:MAG: large conductance mechanosensitive channel protein MscL [Candidatus Aenigmarchaeota archaeon]|nr:large conductance mechanosensitive channel protein MscL [Candidatus Aenigmarchaeota archaeon]
MGFWKEFKEFLSEYKIIGLAIAFIIGSAASALVQSLVNDIIMPVISVFIPDGEWHNAVLQLGPVAIKWGSFLSAAINFLIIALVVFIVAKKLMKEEKPSKK